MKKIIGIIILLLLITTSLHAVAAINTFEDKKIISTRFSGDDIDDFIIETMDFYHVPGASVSLVQDENIIFSRSYGYANITKGTIVEDTTLFYLASVSKTFAAVAIMQLYEEGLFDLDDPINDYLPFQVIHPAYPSVDITFHMLLTHSSGIKDNYNIIQLHIGDSPNQLRSWLQDYLIPGGQYYDLHRNFRREPGTERYYTNVGFGLVGYLVEIISGMSFDKYCEINIFEPLDMTETSWFLRDLDIDNIAVPYVWNGTEQVPQPHWGRDFYPASTLRTSASQLNNYLIMIINKGEYIFNRILEESTVDYMLTLQLAFHERQGISFYQYDLFGRTLWCHHGGLPGLATFLSYYPNTNSGVIVLTNGDESEETFTCIDKIAKKLYDSIENPYEPNIDGSTNGKIGIEYEYIFNAIDPNGDDVKYNINWGDGNNETTDFYPSGVDVKVNHSWKRKGDYIIKVTAEDIDGFVSQEGTMEITMPKNKCSNNLNPFLLKLIQLFPNLN
jgi:CubicO group peptidase (beta-lactamase class C family)